MTARRPSEESLKQEVRELTDLLRNDSAFAEIRDMLIVKGLSVENTVLAGLIEGEGGDRYGAIITASTECIRFEIASNGVLVRWEMVRDPDELTSDFQAVSIGIAMKRDREAC